MSRAQVVTIVLVSLFLVGLVVSAITPWMTPSPRAFRSDSFSGRQSGYRGLYDLLHAFKVPAHRFTDVPPGLFTGNRRVLLLEPVIGMIEREKGYLAHLGEWLRQGGQIVIVTRDLEFLGRDDSEDEEKSKEPSTKPADENEAEDASDEEPAEDARESDRRHRSSEERMEDIIGEDELLQRLGVGELWIEPPVWNEWDPETEDETLGQAIGRAFRRGPAPDTEFDASAKGTFAGLDGSLKKLKLPENYSWFEGEGIEKAVGRIDAIDEDGEEYPVALQFRTEQGEVTLVAEPSILNNAGLGLADNAVAAFALAAGDGTREVILDEYYHGSLEGLSAVALFAVYPYGVVGFSVLFAALLWAWSHGVRFGVPAPHGVESRRSILEYVDAMSRLFRRGRKNGFVLHTNRQGVLDEVRAALHLAHGTPEPRVLRRLAQVDPEAGERLSAVLKDVDAELRQGENIPLARLLELQERLEKCRTSKNRSLTHRSVPQTALRNSTAAPSHK